VSTCIKFVEKVKKGQEKLIKAGIGYPRPLKDPEEYLR
jgi:hypothetical protein